MDDPVVAREINRAQRIVEGQNFDIRRTLWRYSALVDDQRSILYRWRHDLLHGESDPGVWETHAPREHAALVAAVGEEAVRRAEQRVTMFVLDREWADHLALIEDVREGIHLQRYGGREPLTEFHRQIVEAFSAMMERINDESLAILRQLEVRSGEIDLSAANAGRLRDALAPFISAARRAGAGRSGPAGGSPARTSGNRAQNQAIREWAIGQGMKVSERGRIPTNVLTAYHAAH